MREAFRIHITDEALSNIEGIHEFIFQQSPQNAEQMVKRLIESIDGLNFMPARFKVVGTSRTTGSDVHAMVVRPFIIYYRVEVPQQTVWILTVRHGAQEQPSAFA